MHADVKGFWRSQKDSSYVLLKLTQMWYQDVQLELFQYRIRFYPDRLKSVGENETKRLWPPAKVKVTESDIKWWKSMVPVSMAVT